MFLQSSHGMRKCFAQVKLLLPTEQITSIGTELLQEVLLLFSFLCGYINTHALGHTHTHTHDHVSVCVTTFHAHVRPMTSERGQGRLWAVDQGLAGDSESPLTVLSFALFYFNRLFCAEKKGVHLSLGSLITI